MAGADTDCCSGIPISVTGPLDFLGRVLDRLNICGIRARLSELVELPSVGCNCWKDSNSLNNALRLLR